MQTDVLKSDDDATPSSNIVLVFRSYGYPRVTINTKSCFPLFALFICDTISIHVYVACSLIPFSHVFITLYIFSILENIKHIFIACFLCKDCYQFRKTDITKKVTATCFGVRLRGP